MKLNDMLEELTKRIAERSIGNFLESVTIEVNVDLSKHADERRFRHGQGDEIDEEEIIATAEEASDKILQYLINNRMDVGDEFVIRDNTYDLNLVGVLERTRDPSVLSLTVITVMRKENFKPKSGDIVIDIY